MHNCVKSVISTNMPVFWAILTIIDPIWAVIELFMGYYVSEIGKNTIWCLENDKLLF